MNASGFPLDIDIAVETGDWPDGLEPLADRAISAALEIGGFTLDGPAELSILLTDDAHQQVLNRDWRQKDGATNVLSFPGREPDEPLAGLIGDIALACETLVREADALQVSFQAHFTHLLVHGFLHCLGFDHQSDDEALAMEGLETQILSALGIDDPYVDR